VDYVKSIQEKLGPLICLPRAALCFSVGLAMVRSGQQGSRDNVVCDAAEQRPVDAHLVWVLGTMQFRIEASRCFEVDFPAYHCFRLSGDNDFAAQPLAQNCLKSCLRYRQRLLRFLVVEREWKPSEMKKSG
jgi:hypothetical protein